MGLGFRVQGLNSLGAIMWGSMKGVIKGVSGV